MPLKGEIAVLTNTETGKKTFWVPFGAPCSPENKNSFIAGDDDYFRKRSMEDKSFIGDGYTPANGTWISEDILREQGYMAYYNELHKDLKEYHVRMEENIGNKK